MPGISIPKTVGVRRMVEVCGFILEARPLISELVEGGIHLSDDLVRETLKLAGEA